MEDFSDWAAKKEARRERKQGRKHGSQYFGGRHYERKSFDKPKPDYEAKRQEKVTHAVNLGSGPDATAYGCRLKPAAYARLVERFYGGIAGGTGGEGDTKDDQEATRHD